jgi:diacylglycerol kinase (ATP)
VPSRTLVVANPKSRSGATGRRLERTLAHLRGALGEIEVEWTRGPRDAERIAREGVRAGVSRLVVAGGDGTTSEIVTGILEADLGSEVELAVLPMGTGADLIRSLGVPRDLSEAIGRIAEGSRRRIDAGRVRFVDRSGRERTTYFANVASFGVSGLVTELVNHTTKALGGRISFLAGTLRAIARYRPEEVSVVVDGKTVSEGPLILATAANGRYFGSGMHVAPEARVDDGLLDVVSVQGVSRMRLLRDLPHIYRGSHVGRPGVALHRGRCVEARAEPGRVWIEIDGEPLGTLPARVDVLPLALTLVGCAS